jgi:biopolymer transport protein ExbD
MSMQLGGGKQMSDINVTPFVDICLVLLIIFMVITPLLSRTLDVAVPPKSEDQTVTSAEAADQLIMTVRGPVEGPKILLNREELQGGIDEVRSRVEELMKGRGEKVVFFQAANEVPYDFAIRVMDEIRGGGAVKIGLITDENLDAAFGAAE